MKKTILAVMFAGSVLTAQASNVMNDSSKNIGEMVSDSLFENPIGMVSQHPGYCSIFHSWGFIGDSLCSGEHEYHKPDGSKGYIDLYDYSWGQRICSATGAKGENYSQGGETVRGWIEHFGMLLRIIIIILMQKQTQSRLI